jgi:hypothetical protein
LSNLLTPRVPRRPGLALAPDHAVEHVERGMFQALTHLDRASQAAMTSTMTSPSSAGKRNR